MTITDIHITMTYIYIICDPYVWYITMYDIYHMCVLLRYQLDKFTVFCSWYNELRNNWIVCLVLYFVLSCFFWFSCGMMSHWTGLTYRDNPLYFQQCSFCVDHLPPVTHCGGALVADNLQMSRCNFRVNIAVELSLHWRCPVQSQETFVTLSISSSYITTSVVQN